MRGSCARVLMVIGDSGDAAVFGSSGQGDAERMIAYPVKLSFIAFGGYLMAQGVEEDLG